MTLTRGLTAVSAPLSRALGVVVDDGSGEQEVHWLVQRNAPLPARGSYEFKTTIALEPGGEVEIIQIHIVEGTGENMRPQRQRSVGELTITDSHVNRNVPAGNPVEVRIDISESRLLSAEAYLPFVDQTFSAAVELGTDEVDLRDLRSALDAERTRLGTLTQHIPASASRELHESLREAEENVLSAVGAGEPEAIERSLRSLQRVQSRIDQFEDAQRLPLTVAEAREESEIASNIVSSFGNDGHKARLKALIVDLDMAIASGSVSEIRRAESKLTRLKWELLWNQLGWWSEYFNYMASSIQGWTDSGRASVLIRQGRAALVQEDVDSLRQACLELRDLIRPEDQVRVAAFQNVGIRR